MKIKITSIIKSVEYLFAIFLILSLNSVYFCASNGVYRNIITILLLFFTIILNIYGLLRMKQLNEFVNKLVIFVLLFFIYIGIMYMYNVHMGYAISSYQLLILFVFPIFLLPVIYYQKQEKYRLLLVIRDIIFIIAMLSLVGWILKIIGIHTNTSLFVNWGSNYEVKGYFGISYFAQGIVKFFGMMVQRNTGIFVEAPMFAYVLILALTISVFIDNHKSNFKKFIIIMAIFSTTSTTALIMFIMIFLVKYIINMPTDSLKKINKIVLFVIILIFFYIIIYYLLMNKKNDMIGSYSLRQDDIIAGIEAWKLHPLMGNGLNNIDALVNQMSTNRWLTDSTGYSSGIFYILASGGIYLLMMYIFPIFATINKKNICILELLNFFLLLNIIVPISFTVIFILMVGVGEWVYN